MGNELQCIILIQHTTEVIHLDAEGIIYVKLTDQFCAGSTVKILDPTAIGKIDTVRLVLEIVINGSDIFVIVSSQVAIYVVLIFGRGVGTSDTITPGSFS